MSICSLSINAFGRIHSANRNLNARAGPDRLGAAPKSGGALARLEPLDPIGQLAYIYIYIQMRINRRKQTDSSALF
jgi:hypothetical protein